MLTRIVATCAELVVEHFERRNVGPSDIEKMQVEVGGRACLDLTGILRAHYALKNHLHTRHTTTNLV